MNFIDLCLLALIEGITEFLPVSSTGHLILVQKLTGTGEVNPFVTVALQFAAIFAAIIYFRTKIGKVIKEFFVHLKQNDLKNDKGIHIFVSILPILIIGFLFNTQIKDVQDSLVAIGFFTIIFGIIFYLVENFIYKPSVNNLNKQSFKTIFVMGLFQTLALLPGVSRSGITIVGGLTQKVHIKDAIETSFLLSIPVMFAASLYELFTFHGDVPAHFWTELGVGMLISFITAFFSITVFLRVLEKVGFLPFMVYRIGIGVLMIVVGMSL